ncbi:MAG TPA: substrate-binding domain-containing protein, partial [Acidimicrobiales bacterium]|nr:substrate-binding domain-containing protein [Acidimicrobiales bacterium]
EAGTLRPDYTTQANDNAIIQGIEGSESSFGWVGFAFAEEAGDGVKEIPIADDEGTCIEPTTETIADGSYPLSRSLYIYVSKAAAEDNPAVAAFVDFYVNEGLAEVTEVGYVDLPEDRVATTQETWEARTTGSAVAAGG